MMRRSQQAVRVLLASATLIVGVASVATAHAQSASTIGTSTTGGAAVLPDRMSASARTAIQVLSDSLHREALPGDALIDKAAEGALKGATDDRIVSAVRALAQRLRLSRTLLGGVAARDELLAASSALFAGVPSAAIARFAETQRARPNAVPLTVPLSIVAELASARVPSDLAFSSVNTLVARGAGDADLRAFRAGVEHDIRQGQSPRDAASAGVQRTLRGIDRVP